MNPLRWLSALLLALAFAAGAALWLQRQAAAQLRDEITLLRDQNRELARLRAENLRLAAALPPTAELEQLRADHAAVVRLRAELEKTKDHLQARERALTSPPLIPASEWKNAGRATPVAAVETFLWAAARHDTDAVAAMLGFGGNLRQSVDAFFSALPEALRTQYGTVDRLLAEFMTKDLPLAAMRLPAGPQSSSDWGCVFNVYLEDKNGFAKDNTIVLLRADDGWRLAVLPQTAQKIANEIGRQLAAERKGG
jgi:hypothetical protein